MIKNKMIDSSMLNYDRQLKIDKDSYFYYGYYHAVCMFISNVKSFTRVA